MDVLKIDVPFEHRFRCWFCGEGSDNEIEVRDPQIHNGEKLIAIPICDECESYKCHTLVKTLDVLRDNIKDKIITNSSKALSIGANWTKSELKESNFEGHAFEGFKRSGWEMYLIAKERVNFKAWELCIDGVPASNYIPEETYQFDGLSFTSFTGMLDYLSKTFFLNKPFLKQVLTLYGNDRAIEAVKFCRLVPNSSESQREMALDDLIESFKEKEALALKNKKREELNLNIQTSSILPVKVSNITVPVVSIQWAMNNGVIDFETLDLLEDSFFKAFSNKGESKAIQLFNGLEIYLDKRLSSPIWRKEKDPNASLWEYIQSKI